MDARRWSVAATLVAVAVIVWSHYAREREREVLATAARSSRAGASGERTHRDDEPTYVGESPHEEPTGATPTQGSARVPDNFRDPRFRAKMREAIWRGLNTPAPPVAMSAQDAEPAAYVLPKVLPAPPAGEAGQIEPEYIQQRIRDDFWGRARWCYEQAGRRCKPGLRREEAGARVT